jgi:hypothetical protein
MAKSQEQPADSSWEALFAHLREQKAAVVEVAARDTGIRAERLHPAFDQILDLVAEPVPAPAKIDHWREQGVALAREGAPSERVFDAYLSLNWAIWEAVMGAEDIERGVILEFADRLLRGLDDAIAAISEGYVRVEVEMAAAHADRRRAVLEDVLLAPRDTPQDRARIRLRCERNGLAVGDTYRLFLIHLPGRSLEELDTLIDDLERRIRVPATHHHDRPGIRLPVVLDWRGRALVFATADWAGERRLREAIPAVLGEDVVVVDTGPIEGVEALVDARANAEYSAAVAEALGRRGWLDDPGDLALETTFLLDEQLVQTVVERELGPLLADARMGQELIETLEVYLGAKQNIREAARRLHLAPRTVAYRLERIESLLGRELEGDTVVRVSAALVALRVSRQAGVIGAIDAPTQA